MNPIVVSPNQAEEPMRRLVHEIADALSARREWLATAESCTGGLIAKLLTDRPGSSRWFERGIVSYSNAAKESLLGVSPETIATHGAVSAATVIAMADGVVANAPVQWAISVSGVAGPDGGTADKPVGTVWIGWAGSGMATAASRFVFPGDRESVRAQSAQAALRGLRDLLLAG